MIKTNRYKTIIILLFILVTLIWGAGFPLVKSSIEHGIPELFIMATRFSIASVSLIIIRSATKNKRNELNQTKILNTKILDNSVLKETTKKNSYGKQEIMIGSFLGVLIFIAFMLQSFGLGMTTPAKSGILTSCYVIIVPLITIVFSKKFLIKPLVDAAICLFGMMIFFNVFQSFSNIGLGDWLTIAGAAVFALHMIYLEKYSKNLDVLDLSIFQMISCAILSIIFSLIFEINEYAAMDWKFMIGAMLFLGIFSTGFAYLVQTLAQKNFSATTVSMISCLEAVFATGLSVMLKMESLTPELILGGLFIIFSILRSVLLPIENNSKFLYF